MAARLGLVAGVLALVACAHHSRPLDQRARRLDQRAQLLEQRAIAVEPSITPVLIELAADIGAEMIKLEHRLKTRSSIARKLDKEHTEKPDIPIDALTLNDTVRYTMRIEDEPPGHHAASIKVVLAALEARGHEVVRLKNYWPPSDNYSGINCVLRHPSGLEWELQFHTARSIEINDKTRAWYEELREVTTPIERKRELFEKMTREWRDVTIPEGVLRPRALHEREEIIEHPRP